MAMRPPSRRGSIHHIDLTVSDPKASYPLYDLVLTFLGYERGKVNADGGTEWDHPGDSFLSIGIAKAKGESCAGIGLQRHRLSVDHRLIGLEGRMNFDAAAQASVRQIRRGEIDPEKRGYGYLQIGLDQEALLLNPRRGVGGQ